MKKIYIIAEAGVNHNGNIEIALKMVDIAKECGADAIKFQTFKASALASERADKADYQKLTTGNEESQVEMLKKLELDKNSHLRLLERAKARKIDFISSAFDHASADLLHEMGLSIWKISSGEISNIPLLRKIGKFPGRKIVSTGMATLSDVELCVRTLLSTGTKKSEIILLHCGTEYPLPFEEVNLNAMRSLQAAFNMKVGYSDHTEGITIAIAAAAIGAVVIEKHFTLDKRAKGPDHSASLEPLQLKEMIKQIRIVEKAMGTGEKIPFPSEKRNALIAKKSIVAAVNIKKGEMLDENNLTAKRPCNGIDVKFWDLIIGTMAKRNYKPDDKIEL